MQQGWRFKLGIVTVVLLVTAALWWVLLDMGMPTSFSASAISDWLGGKGAMGPLLLALMMVLGVVVGPIPTLPISAASGLAFGVALGTLVSITGAMVGAMVAFMVARLLGRDALRQRLDRHPLFAADGSQRLLFLTVLVTRLVPIFSFALVSYAAGVTAISPWRFALASLVGMLPMTVVFASLGTTFELNPLLTTLAAVAILAVMTLLPYYLSRRPRSTLARWLGLSSKTSSR
jgi:uncharacterized membrane protein YdjX (TVP38/TMEM64 family)